MPFWNRFFRFEFAIVIIAVFFVMEELVEGKGVSIW